MQHSKKHVVYLLAFLLFSAGWIAPLRAVEPIGQYTLRFEGKKQSDNTEVPLTQVTISNLTQGCDTTITSATFLLKVLPAKTSVGSIETIPSLQARLISENPFMQSTEVEVSLPFSSPLHLALVGLDGKIQQRYDGYFGSGVHRFSIEPANAGLSFLSISNGIERQVLKLIRLEGGSAAQIRPAGSSEEPAQGSSPETAGQLMFRSATQPFVCYEGDQLQLIGYAEGFANSSIYDSPVKDGDYAFIFEAPFYRIQGHHVKTNPPSFVDVLFSVEDFSYKGVDNLSNQDFVIKENGKKVGSEGFPYIRKMNTVPYTIQTVLLLDNSYSLSTADREKMKAAAISLINSKEDNQEIAVYCFSNETILLQDFTTDTELLVQAVESIGIGDASTNLYGAYIEGVGRFTNVFTPEEINQGFMVVFSDGDDTANNYSIRDATNARRNKRVYMVGLGEDIDPATLEELANPGPHFSITSADLLERVFLQIQQDIVRYANSFYWLNYLSPTRAGYIQLEVEINQNPNTGSDASYPADFPATNFESAPLGGGVYIDPYLKGNGKEGYAPEYILKNESDQYTLSVVTYWANNLPSYVWSSSDERIARIEVAPRSFNEAELIFPTENNPGGIATITVRDEANTGVDGKIFERTLQVQAMTAPRLTTREVSDITYHTATTGGVITDEGGLSITQRGVRYGTLREELDRQIYNNSGEDEFACELTGLESGTTYYVQAYALNRKGEGYGEILSFRTPDAVVPTVTTGEATDITDNSARCTATVTAENGASVTEQGVCWSTTNNPTTADSKATGSNNIILSDLQPNTTYYVRAYAVNSAGTGYGEVKTFKTNMSLPRLTTQAATDITLTSAKVGGSITDAGVPAYTERGICYATTNNPTIDNNKLPVAGSGTGDFSASMTGLTVGTTYYFRTYAINEKGVAYGSSRSFRTPDMTLPVLTTQAATDITPTSAMVGGSITNVGLPAYTERGICYATTTSNPTIDNNKLPVAGDGTDDFSANLTGLTAGTTYYFRTYAINEKGVAYGSSRSFRTLMLPSVTTGEITNITATSASCKAIVTNDGGSSVTEMGVCWSATNENPTTTNSQSSGSNVILTGLSPYTTYYVRAYVISSAGIGYGEVKTFTTTMTPPIVTTKQIVDITSTSATLVGSITDIGIPTYTEKGICYATTSNLTIEDNKLMVAGDGIGDFSVSLTGLTAGTIYYFRAYAINEKDTAYGGTLSFKTFMLPSIVTGEVTDISYDRASCTLTQVDNGGTSVTEIGVCWSTTNNPTTTDSKSEGRNSVDLSGLQPGTTYYVRAYVVNSVGTGYGNVVTFKTREIPSNGVLLDGMCWAASNVGSSGTFVANPEGYGNYYTWSQAQTACPKGWRLPTVGEIDRLLNRIGGGTWTTVNGTYGRRFGSGSNTVFLPAAGNNSGGSLNFVGSNGYYWTATGINVGIDAFYLYFVRNNIATYLNDKTSRYCVRCVLAE